MTSLILIAALVMNQGADAPKKPETMQLRMPLGTIIKSELKLIFSDPAEDFMMTTIDHFESKVIAIGPDEISFEHKVSPVYIKMDGLEKSTPDAEPSIVNETRNRVGCLKKYEGTIVDEQANLMIARLWTVPLPNKYPNIGSDWVFTDQRFIPYEFKGVSRQELENKLILDVSYKGLDGDPLDMRGTAAIQVSSGWPMRIDLKGKGCLVPGGEGERVSLTLEWVTKEVIIPKS